MGPNEGVKHFSNFLFWRPEGLREVAWTAKTVKNWPPEASGRKNRPKLSLFYVLPLYTAVAFPYDIYKTGQKCFKPACGAAMAATSKKRRVGGRNPV